MTNKIRLGLIGASVQRHLVGAFPPAGIAGQFGRGVDGGLHHPG
jgi:hypothetical protein